MHRRLAALMGMLGFILVAGYWAARSLYLAMEGGVDVNMPSVEWVLVRALVALVCCFLMGWVLSRLGVGLLNETLEQLHMQEYRPPSGPTG